MIRFSSLRPSFLEYKYVKAVFDYGRVHDVMLCASPDHRSLNFQPGNLEECRVVADDLLSSLVSTWDALTEAKLLAESIAPSVGGKKQRLGDRLKTLKAKNPSASAALSSAWQGLFADVNDARNEYQHEGYWKNLVGVGQAGGPFGPDLIAKTTRGGSVYVLREARQALRALHSLNSTLGIQDPLDPFVDRCTGCIP